MNLKEKTIHNNLINAIQDRIKGTPADIISEILPLSKESIYRRLRGDVYFTLFEAVFIAQKLNISLDETLMIDSQSQLWKQNLEANVLDTESYHNNISRWGKLIKNYADHPQSQLYLTITDHVLPLMSSYNDLLIRFVYYQSLFENGGLAKNYIKFSELEIPASLIGEIRIAFDAFAHLNKTCIINPNTYSLYMARVEYMKTLELITEEETKDIKSNLYSSLEHLRNLCNNGQSDAGSKFEAYICETNSGSSFGVLEDDANSILFIKLLGLNYMTFEDEKIINTYNQLFANLKNLSTLVSSSGSAQRVAFFKEQFALFE